MGQVIGIDLGAHAVKVALYEGSFGRFEALGCHSRDVPQDGSAVPTITERLVTLGALLDDLDIDSASGVSAIAVPAEQASMRVVALPFTDRAQVEKTVPFEVESHVPFDLDGMVFTWRTLGVDEAGTKVLAGLVRRGVMHGLLEACSGLELDPKHVAIDADILATHADEGVCAVLDLGHSRSLVSLVVDGQTWSARAIDVGGEDLTRAVQTACGVEWAEAEGIKHSASLTGPTPVSVQADGAEASTDHAAAVRQALEAGVQRLAVQLRATLVAFEDTHGVEIDEVRLVGGGAALDGLPGLLAQEFGVPVRRVAVEAGPNEAPGRFALADALARRATGESRGRPLELRTGEFAHHGQLAMLQTIGAYAAAAGFCFLLAGFMVFLVKAAELGAQVRDVEDQIGQTVLASFPDVSPDEVEDASDAFGVMQDKSMETIVRVETLAATLDPQPPTLTILKELHEAMPSAGDAKIDVRELTISEVALNFEADTDGYESASDIEASLQNSERFSEASKGDEKKVGDSVRFSMTVPFESDESEG